jgi:hypothetical protein
VPSIVRLHAHPSTQWAPPISVEASVWREAGTVRLQYIVSGNIPALFVPPPARSQRRDELWKHTCAELFVAAPEHHAYCEFNFSPSSEWAAYAFDDYRQGSRQLACESPIVGVRREASLLRLTVECHLPASLAAAQVLQGGISVVIDDTQSRMSYWALRHPADRPDFHRRDGFVLEL